MTVPWRLPDDRSGAECRIGTVGDGYLGNCLRNSRGDIPTICLNRLEK